MSIPTPPGTRARARTSSTNIFAASPRASSLSHFSKWLWLRSREATLGTANSYPMEDCS